ncbi:hypothetical protein [Nitrosopumilus adriaticus]|uniref:hypothetical protein n=1 Tax=Nitrosopumilus adriaticus TaxID=1580092 RepID=UPI00352F030A
MGFFDALKKSRKQVNRENQEQGKAGERKIKEEYEFSGYKVTRTGKGHDLKAEKKDWFTGQKKTKYIEVKTGNSKLSKLQKKKRGHLGDKYVVERLEPTPFGLTTNNRESDLSTKKQKENRSNPFGFGNTVAWGSSSPKRKATRKKTTRKKTTPKKKSSSIFGSSSMDSIFGSSSPKRKTTRKKTTPKKKSSSIFGSSSMDSIFGSSSPKRKATRKKTTRKKTTPKKKSSSIWGTSSKSKKNTGIW